MEPSGSFEFEAAIPREPPQPACAEAHTDIVSVREAFFVDKLLCFHYQVRIDGPLSGGG
jgi:hypothetical protein